LEFRPDAWFDSSGANLTCIVFTSSSVHFHAERQTWIPAVTLLAPKSRENFQPKKSASSGDFKGKVKERKYRL
jgi:hypothetical protein